MSDVGNYIPKHPQERALYEALWVAAGPVQDSLGGAPAVGFFEKSGIDKGILRQIWGLSTSGSTLNKEQFFTALRYITMFQNGELPLNKEKLQSSASVNFPPPRLVGVQLPTPPSPAPGGLPPPAAYAISPEEATKYAALFKSYDNDNDGFLLGGEAVPLFSKSGLDFQVLRSVWDLADDDKDSKLSLREFSVAFHLILCISKRNLPLPPALPAPLKAFLGHASQPSSAAPQATPPSPHIVPQATPPVAPAPHKAVSIGDAFGDVDDAPLPSLNDSTHSSHSHHSAVHTAAARPAAQPRASPSPNLQHSHSGAHAGISDAEQHDLTSGIMAVSDAAKKTLAVQQQGNEALDKSNSNIKFLLQRLATDKISLTASVKTAEDDIAELSSTLNASFAQLQENQKEVDELRLKLFQLVQQKAHMQGTDSAVSQHKVALLKDIEALQKQLSALSQERSTTANMISSTEQEDVAVRAQSAQASGEITATKDANNKANAEIQLLQEIISKLQAERRHAESEVQALKTSLQSSEQKLAADKSDTATKLAELSKVKSENQSLQGKIAELEKQLKELMSLAHQPSTVSAPAAAPAAVAITAPMESKQSASGGFDDISTSVPASSPQKQLSSGFDDISTSVPAGSPQKQLSSGFDDAGFGSNKELNTSPASAGFDDAFGDADFGSNATPTASGFSDADFGVEATSAPKPSGNDAFDDADFGVAPAAPSSGFGDDAFGSGDFSAASNAFSGGFDDAGFGSAKEDAFGASFDDNASFGSAPAAPAAAFGDAGFGAFGDDMSASSAPAASSGFADTTFDAGFGSAPASGFGDDAFGDAGFGAAAPQSKDATPASGFDGDGFGDATPASGFDGDGFGDATPASGFDGDGFGDATPASGFDGDGFGDSGFGAAPAVPSAGFDDAFGSSNADGFGADFGSADNAFGSDGFDAFGKAPASGDGFGNDSGFGDF